MNIDQKKERLEQIKQEIHSLQEEEKSLLKDNREYPPNPEKLEFERIYDSYEISEKVKRDILKFVKKPMSDFFGRPSLVWYIGSGTFKNRQDEGYIEDSYCFETLTDPNNPTISFEVTLRAPASDLGKDRDKINWEIYKVKRYVTKITRTIGEMVSVSYV